jgi:hypothetical protein
MENNNTVNTLNTVTIPLSDYNSLKNEVENAKQLAIRWQEQTRQAERVQEDKNKIIVIQKQVPDLNYGGMRTVETLKLDIDNPEASTKILDIISKVDTAELSKKIEEKENEVKILKVKYQETLDVLENTERMFKHSARRDEDAKKEEIRKLKKGYEDSILDLEIDKETLVKALADLKKDKTQVQIELARQEEIDDLKSKVLALQSFRDKTNSIKNPWKLRRFLQAVIDSNNWVHANAWASGLYSKTISAVDRIESFTRMLKEVGKVEKTPDKKKYAEPVSYTNTSWGGVCVSASSIGY